MRVVSVGVAVLMVGCGGVPGVGDAGAGGRAGQSGGTGGAVGGTGGMLGGAGGMGVAGAGGGEMGGAGGGQGGMAGGGAGAGGVAGAGAGASGGAGAGGRGGAGGSGGMAGAGAGGAAGAGGSRDAGMGGTGMIDAGVRDAGMMVQTCMSNMVQPAANRYQASSNMNPGLACRACHVGMNFDGQNPMNRSAPAGDRFYFAGTIYPSANERDFCIARPPAAIAIEILGPDGGVQLSLNPSANSGNFFSSGVTTAPRYLPYTARVLRNGQIVHTMRTPQMNGDCNICHTAVGASGAPGRIIW